MDPLSFDRLPRDELVAKARSLGVERPELMTRVELGDEIVRRTQSDPSAQRQARGWLGVARDLVASVVESGLNLPDAAAIIRGERGDADPAGPAPVATVTLAEIYATQGHTERALRMLDEVLGREPDHPAALALLERLRAEPARRRAGQAPPELADVRGRGEEAPRTEPPPPLVEHDTEPPPPLVAAESEPPPSAETEAELVPPPLVEPEPEPPPLLEPVPPSSEAEHTPIPFGLRAPPVEAAAAAEPLLVSELTSPLPPAAPEPAPETASARLEPTPTPATLLIVRTSSVHPLLCWDCGELAPPSGAELEIDCLAFSAAPTGPVRRELKLPLPVRRGSLLLTDVDAGALVRAALGYREAGSFVPLVIASELSAADGSVSVRFRPPLSASNNVTELERTLLNEFAT